MKPPKLHVYLSLVRDFMDAFDQKCYASPDFTPPEVSLLRHDLIEEEVKEYMRAPVLSTEELDAICDILYVTLGTNAALGVPLAYTPGVLIYKDKLPLYDISKECLQDLACRFPCLNVQIKALNYLSSVVAYDGLQKGYDLDGAFVAVHSANMSKLWKPKELPAMKQRWMAVPRGDRFLVKDHNGKVTKSPSFQAPNLEQFMPKV